MILNKNNKTLGLLRKLHNILPTSALLTIYKDFVRSHLDYGSIYEQAYNATFHRKLELIQYNACLALTRANKRYFKREILWRARFGVSSAPSLVKKTVLFYKFYENELPQYLFKLIPVRSSEYSTFKKYFFLSAIIQWNNSHNPKPIKFITRLRLILSHLREHKFKHSFQDLLNPISSCGLDIESPLRYLLHYPT